LARLGQVRSGYVRLYLVMTCYISLGDVSSGLIRLLHIM